MPAAPTVDALRGCQAAITRYHMASSGVPTLKCAGWPSADRDGLDPEVADHGPAFLARVRLSWTGVHGTARLVLDGALRQPTKAVSQRMAADIIATLQPALVVPLPLADAAPSP